jgi:hypothetical protein
MVSGKPSEPCRSIVPGSRANARVQCLHLDDARGVPCGLKEHASSYMASNNKHPPTHFTHVSTHRRGSKGLLKYISCPLERWRGGGVSHAFSVPHSGFEWARGLFRQAPGAIFT